MHPRHCNLKNNGFSLIQISVILMVGAVIMASLLPGGKNGDYNQKVAANIVKLDAIEAAMTGFMSINGRRPCPADGQSGINTANFGMEAAIPGTCTGGTPAAPLTSGSYVVAGSVPTKSLNLPDEYAFDAWGRSFTYVVDKRVTLPFSCYLQQTTPYTGAITVNNNVTNTNGTDTVISTDTMMVAYISYGATGHGAFPEQGSTAANRINKGITDADSNTNAGSSPFSSSFTSTLVKKDRTPTFDDFVYYRKDTMNVCATGNGVASNALAGFIAQGGSNDSAGSALAIGDINGDGIDDLIIGAPGSNKVYVLFGSKTAYLGNGFSSPLMLSSLTNATTPKGFTITGSGSFGASVAIGDINGDGIKDIIIGAPTYNSNAGAVYVVFGATGTWSNLNVSSLSGSNGFRIDANSTANDGTSANMGTSVAAGDVNADGVQDVIIGAPGATVQKTVASVLTSYPNAGKVYVVFGSQSATPPWSSGAYAVSSITSSTGVEIDNDDSNAEAGKAGTSVAGGDINVDGTDDIIIGAPNATGGGTTSGKAYVVFGSGSWTTPSFLSSYVNGTGGFTLTGVNAGDLAGTSVSVGDVNGDGMMDVIVGAPGAAPQGRNAAGSTYAVYGKTTAWSSTYSLASLTTTGTPAGFRLDGSTGEHSGNAVSTGCSVTATGIDTLLIGAPLAGSGSSSCATGFPTSTTSSSYVVYGSSNGWISAQNLCSLNTNNSTPTGMNGFYALGQAANDKSGSALASLDIGATGKCATAIGAPGAPTGNNNGYIYVIMGRSAFSQSMSLGALR